MLEVPFSERASMKKVTAALAGLPWEPSPFKIQLDDADQYHTFNEYNYFHGYVRDALALTLNEQETTRRFRYLLPSGEEKPAYEISIGKGKDNPPIQYKLIIRDILLTCYDIGVGFLAFFLENRETGAPEDILRINDFGRRIYPQFLGYAPKPEEQGENKEEEGTTEEVSPLDAPKASFLADTISLTGISKEPIKESFSYYKVAASLNGEPFRLPEHISYLLGPKFAVATRETKQTLPRPSILLSPLIDDRMYVLCYYFAAPELSATLRRFDQEKGNYSYAASDFWYSYLFVDPSLDPSCRSRPMMEKLLKRHTYDRWIEYQDPGERYQIQLYGISRYSFMMLVDRSTFTEKFLINHHRYLYFQAMALALTQRAAILRFAAEAANISEEIKTGKDIARQKRAIREVYRGYLYFTNKVYFREITPQEQGIELYDMAREIMEIDPDLHALQQEIEELHNYALLMEGEKSSQEAALLTRVATVFLPPTLVIGVFGFSNPPKHDFTQNLICAIVASLILIALVFLVIWLLNLRRRRL
ncbi:MAG: hypothetical protein H6559_35005 [Lewinellaceae bacterium]|nr:hypothetical protein [Lewinellaceae bacterium]